MTDQEHVVSLEERLQILERLENQGGGFSGLSWALLALTGIMVPVLILIRPAGLGGNGATAEADRT